MRKIYLIFCLLPFLASCEKEDILILEESKPVSVEEININDLPLKLKLLSKEDPEKFNENGKMNFGPIRADIPAKKVVNSEGKISYTIALHRPPSLEVSSESFFFDNLLLMSDTNDDWKKVYIRYQPTREWLLNSKDFKDYSGTITFFSKDGNKINTIRLSNGIEKKEKDEQNKEWSTTCKYELVHVATLTSGEGHTSSTLYVYEYKETCTTTYDTGFGGGGYGDGTYNNGPAPDDPEGLPSSGGTAPIIVEETELMQITSDLEGKAECIYKNLIHTAIDQHNIIRDIHLTFGGSSSPTDLIYRQQKGLTNASGVVLNGKTGTEGDSYVITLNSDRIDTRSSIEVAKTIIHESVHAILRSRFNLSETSFTEAFQEYIQSETDWNTISHSIMRDYYIIPISKNLQQYDSYKESEEFYTNLAWEGLHQYLSEEELQEIRNTIKEAQEREGGMDCNE